MKEDYEEYIEKSKQYYDQRFGSEVKDAFKLTRIELYRWSCIKNAVEKFTGKRKKAIEILDFGSEVKDAFKLTRIELYRWSCIKNAVEKFTGKRKKAIEILDFGSEVKDAFK